MTPDPTQPETVLTRELVVQKCLNNLKGPGPNSDPDLFIVAEYIAALRQQLKDSVPFSVASAWELECRRLRQRVAALEQWNTNQLTLLGQRALVIENLTAKLAAVTKDAKDSERHLLGIIAQLLTFAPRDDSSRIPLPGWVVAIIDKAKAALQGKGEGT